jgi:uncharacterized beta-barrel protein YwiB (DUF1934 family)
MNERADKKAVQVNVHSECRSRDEMIPMDVYTTGSLYRKNNNLYVVYDEDNVEEEGTSRTILKVEPGKRVTMTKKGCHELHFVLEKGTHSIGYYSVPEGTLSMGVMTTSLEDRLTMNGGTLKLCYNTDSGGYELFENQVTIEVNPTES